jgi:5-oxoprolinase (ATP-hydrolysing)
MSWEFWIDRGGTFTDCIGVDPDGRPHVAKVLSTDDAPAEAIRQILERNGVVSAGGALPACRVKVGSTVATNALLERRGVATCLVADRGLGDVLTIGTQERPDLFDLDIRKPAPLHTSTVEVGGRVSIEGEVLLDFDADAARAGLEAARRAGASSVAIVLVHAYAHPAQEQRLCALAVEQGFDYVVASHEVAREQGLLARGETTAVDAYLTPLLRGHVASLERALPDSTLRFMQSSGGLTTGARFRGPNALLSGPAGGVVGASRVAAEAGFERAIGFDMGGTSTDVSLIQGGEVDRSFETVVGGVRVRAPMLRIHTVAAGGGSLCRFDGFRFTVGPESAGASPGPLCYGSPDARELAVTDVNLALGRIQGDRFPFDLDREAVMGALSAMAAAVSDAGFELDADGVAAGFVEVANASMARAIAEVSVSRGVDPRDCALVGFGGAGGQHVCAIARSLGMRDIFPPRSKRCSRPWPPRGGRRSRPRSSRRRPSSSSPGSTFAMWGPRPHSRWRPRRPEPGTRPSSARTGCALAMCGRGAPWRSPPRACAHLRRGRGHPNRVWHRLAGARTPSRCAVCRSGSRTWGVSLRRCTCATHSLRVQRSKARRSSSRTPARSSSTRASGSRSALAGCSTS